MTAPATIKPDFGACVSWANRLDMWRGSEFEKGCLQSIADDARKAGELEWHYAAQYAADSGDLCDIDYLIADADLAERQQSVAYRWECRTGRDDFHERFGIEAPQVLVRKAGAL